MGEKVYIANKSNKNGGGSIANLVNSNIYT